jgi:hypothetical protein
MTRSEAQCEASMFPRTIDVVACIIATLVVSDPLAVAVHVGHIRMSLLIAKITLASGALFGGALLFGSLPLFRSPLLLDGSLALLGGPLLRSSLPGRWRRTVLWDISAANATLIPAIAPAPLSAAVPFLCPARNCKAH